MKRWVALLAFTLLVAAVLISASPSHAAVGFTCSIQEKWNSVSPPLNLTNHAGTISGTAQGRCVEAETGSIPGNVLTLAVNQFGPNSFTNTYFGSCVFALNSPGLGVIVGGVVKAHFLNGAVIVVILTPNQICNESSANGRHLSVGVD